MFDRIIVSCDDSHFKDFWVVVAKSWSKYFPDKKISLAFVTDREENDDLVKRMRNYGEVQLFPVIPEIPTANLAKMARHILAGRYGKEICMIEDIDTIPLQRDFIERITSRREIGKFLFVGREVYDNYDIRDKGKFPISNITAESYLFKKIINPLDLNDEDLFNSWKDINFFDHKESINNIPDPSGIGGFSDESLWRVLLNNSDLGDDNFCFIERDVDIKNDWIDRSWWNIDDNKLYSDGYVICNFKRPFIDNYEFAEPVVRYIFGDSYSREKIIP